MTGHLKKLSDLHHKSLQLIYFSCQMHQTLCSAKDSCYATVCIFLAAYELHCKTKTTKKVLDLCRVHKAQKNLREKWQRQPEFQMLPPLPRLAFLPAGVMRSYNQIDEQTINTGSGYEDPPKSLLCVRNAFHSGAAECWRLFSA